MACARLYNYIIDEDIQEDNYSSNPVDVDNLEFITLASASLGMCYLPTITDEDFEDTVGVSHTRDSLVEVINTHMMRRPFHNLLRNRRVDPNNVEDTPNVERELYHPI